MLKKVHNKKAQNTAEYAILIALVIGGVVAMQTYAQRALQARVRDTNVFMARAAGNVALGTKYGTVQYEPYYTNTAEQSDKYSNETRNKTDVRLTANGYTFTNKLMQSENTTYKTQGEQ